MRLLLCVIIVATSFSLFGAWDWAHTVGGAGMERIWDISADAQSNIYAAGDFTDTLWVNGTAYQGFGLSDSFVIKYSPNGEVLWAKSFGSSGEDTALSVGCDAAGNCYVAGYFVETFTCQNLSVESYGMWDAYLLKLDPQGNILWLRSFGGPLNDIGYGLSVTSSGRVYVAGWFADTIQFTSSCSIVSAGGSDVFCCAWEADGSFAWAKRGGMEGVEYGFEVACDEAGNAYVTGVAGAGSQFGDYILSGNGMFLCKYNSLGEVQWLSSSQGAGVIDIAIQPDASAIQYGLVCGRLTGAGAIGGYSFNTPGGSDDAYWAKFDASTGTWLNMQYYGGTASDKGKDCDCEGSSAFLASFEEQADFGGINFSSNGGSDVLLGYGNLGSMQFITAGGEDDEIPTSLKIMPNGCIAIAGWHFGSCQFGSHTIDSNHTANQNAFVACFNPQSSVEDLVIAQQSIAASPNPFYNNLQISCSKGSATNNQVVIFNLRGQIIRRLSPASVTDREMIYLWDGKDATGSSCSTGVYIVKGAIATTKALKLK